MELDSPKDADLTAYLEGARRLQAAGADLLTIADCPIARARMDSSLVACRVHRELGLNVLPHMTCRDRNLNATKALLRDNPELCDELEALIKQAIEEKKD